MVNNVNGLSVPSTPVTRVGSDTAKPVPLGPPDSAPGGSTDKVTLTDSARLLQRLEASVRGGEGGFDQSKVDAVKQQITSGQYTVNTDRIAQSLSSLESDIGRSVQVSRTDNGYTSVSTLTGPQGNSVSRSVEVSYDADTQTLSRSTTLTGPQGNSVHQEGSISRTDGGFEQNVSVTGGDGQTHTYSASYIADPGQAPGEGGVAQQAVDVTLGDGAQSDRER